MSEPYSVLTVSQLNRQVKSYLEHELGIIYVEGELSNLSTPVSGHMYFTLKDEEAQVRCVFFKNRQTKLSLNSLNNGQHIIAQGKLSLYEARGDYQLIVEQLTTAGLGELYQQFEQLKKRLAEEGLFDLDRKQKIPYLPQTIGIISSTTGAALRDILATLARRFPVAAIYIYPSEVQGISAAQQLINALERANNDGLCDVILLARGGGSIEDLWAFNNETLARCIVKSTIPVISGVGHETDFTIADFVADLRAATPTAAAVAATPDHNDLLHMIHQLNTRLYLAINQYMRQQCMRVDYLCKKISSPQQKLTTYWQTLDYLEQRLMHQLVYTLQKEQQRLAVILSHLHRQNPKNKVDAAKAYLAQLTQQLVYALRTKINDCTNLFNKYTTTLNAVSPLATLERGYSITTYDKKILFDAHLVKSGNVITVQLAKGHVHCVITEVLV